MLKIVIRARQRLYATDIHEIICLLVRGTDQLCPCCPCHFTVLLAAMLVMFLARQSLCPHMIVPQTRLSTISDRSFRVTVARAWNRLPTSITALTSLPSFKR